MTDQLTESEVVKGIGSDYEIKYGFHVAEDYFFKSGRGLSHELVDAISSHKDEPDWMRKFRHKSLDYFLARPLPLWGGNVAEIGHAVDIQPYFRHGNHDIGVTEAEPHAEFGLPVGFRQVLADEIFAGDTEIHRADADLAGDLGGGEEGDLDIVDAFDPAAIGSVVADGDDLHAGAIENRRSIVLHPALGGQRYGDHANSPLTVSIRSSQSEKPTAGISSAAPSSVSMRSKRPPPASTRCSPRSAISNTRPV